MMKRISSITAVILILLTFTSCASRREPIPMPDWLPEPEAAFPRADYIAELGEGSSVQEAQTMAVQAIARYISTNVQANLTALKTLDAFDYTNLVQLSSNVDLFGLELTEGWFSEKEDKWYAVAYINREEAWTQYVPVIDQAKREFMGFYEKAEAEDEPFIALHYLQAAYDAAYPFLAALETGRLISPEHEKEYDSYRDIIGSIPARQKEVYTNATLLLNITGDSSNTVTSCLSTVFTGLGFTVSKKGIYTLEAIINDNAVYEGELVMVYPSLELNLINREGRAIFTWSCALGKSAAYSLDKARQRGLAGLVDEINASVADEFTAEMSSN